MSKNIYKYYLAFSYLLNIEPVFKKRLFEFFDYDIEHAFRCDKDELKNFGYPVSRNFFRDREKLDVDSIYSEIIKKNYKFVTFEDKNYPELLKNIDDFPLLLYYKGSFEKCNFDKTLAVVGSRNVTESAKSSLSYLMSSMKNLPITIVSGLAMGADAQAHRCAILNNLSTIGVIGCGIDLVYPSINKDLYSKIENGAGLILSEYPPSTAPIPRNFPQRNRIITGLSYGTLVVEAKLRSGALISANLSLEQGREVMCIPGVITNPNTEGIYKLVKDGAPIVTTTDDIFENLNWDFSTNNCDVELVGDEKNIFDIIACEPVSFEKIQSSMNGMDTSKLMVLLTALEIRGLIKQISGQYILG
ncbi:MAG: DNA-protecting protein DprA [Cyanobacteria bacterium SIG30]|nr:DNA-protecting protein DprA [Cyanobacteria bacterium SIG30]